MGNLQEVAQMSRISLNLRGLKKIMWMSKIQCLVWPFLCPKIWTVLRVPQGRKAKHLPLFPWFSRFCCAIIRRPHSLFCFVTIGYFCLYLPFIGIPFSVVKDGYGKHIPISDCCLNLPTSWFYPFHCSLYQVETNPFFVCYK